MFNDFISVIVLLSFFSLNANAKEADVPFAGVFEGYGRACSGHLYIKTKTIEWISTYAVCKISSYKILEKQFDDKGKRVVYLIEKPSKYCRVKVIEFVKVPMNLGESAFEYWTLIGYQSVDEYKVIKEKQQTSSQNFYCTLVR